MPQLKDTQVQCVSITVANNRSSHFLPEKQINKDIISSVKLENFKPINNFKWKIEITKSNSY